MKNNSPIPIMISLIIIFIIGYVCGLLISNSFGMEYEKKGPSYEVVESYEFSEVEIIDILKNHLQKNNDSSKYILKIYDNSWGDYKPTFTLIIKTNDIPTIDTPSPYDIKLPNFGEINK